MSSKNLGGGEGVAEEAGTKKQEQSQAKLEGKGN